jgi:hypothetical protein
MGTYRNTEIDEAWQKGPSPHQDLLRKLSDACFELIKIIELERSGIRDGDGKSVGIVDAFAAQASDVERLCAEVERALERKSFPVAEWPPIDLRGLSDEEQRVAWERASVYTLFMFEEGIWIKDNAQSAPPGKEQREQTKRMESDDLPF